MEEKSHGGIGEKREEEMGVEISVTETHPQSNLNGGALERRRWDD